MADAKSDPIRYAKDVLLAYDYWRREMPSEIIQSNPSAQAIHEYGSTPGNHKDFLAMVKNATDQIQKANKDSTPDEMLKKERRSIADLKSRLAVALVDAQNVTV